ncbi:hypothetical protein K493DRAFT_317031 [Basidiobolus meristosporus CBS 931.73]|uniref:Uncharacterized protein n=1 Tax=Basidiobolus meristosporus CBS 931.73 TaxID=1314790 RepID=A0A1Y1Y1B1_9FUNG|nr:hypothetical protein K493DRAFT_317031 [Basidiobolus meristosporus CBS 931.73]|eukprot:ORX91793.1 hypothetical protein K493DRAFT_317031 [Basidiobolus meristosporus CBS 931.73]
MNQLFDFMFMENVLGSCNRKLRKYNRSKKREQNLRTRLLLINFRKATKRELASLSQEEDEEFVEVPVPVKHSSDLIMTETDRHNESIPQEETSSALDHEAPHHQSPTSCDNLTSYLVSENDEQSQQSEMGKRCRENMWSEGESIPSGKRVRLCF